MPAQAIEKMRAAKIGKKIGPHSEERKAKISAANKGRTRERIHEKTCGCGATFTAANPSAVFCSAQCKRVSQGRSLKHAEGFRHFVPHCAICRRTDELVGDHHHASGSPRGILCRTCNLAIGNMRDNPTLLRVAAEYLERTERARLSPVVYVSGPITGKPDGNRPAFDQAATKLKASGCVVVNPHEVFTEQVPTQASEMEAYWQRAMRRDIKALVDCTHILMLPGWSNSRGAKLEKHIAEALGMQVAYLYDEVPA
jgi:hypothetical protein